MQKKRLVVFSLLSSALVATIAWAKPVPVQPIGPGVQPKPPLTAQLPPLINAVRRSLRAKGQPDTSRYAGGALSYDVEVVNRSNTALTTELIVERHEQGSSPLRVPVNIPPQGRDWLTVRDPLELARGCGRSTAAVRLEGGPSRVLDITPSCSFTASVVEPLKALPPDRRLAIVSGKVWYHSPKFHTALPPACSTSIVGEATVRNDSPSAVAGAFLRLRGSAPDGDERSTARLQPGQERTVRFEGFFTGQRGPQRITIDGTGTVPTHQPGSYIDVERSCSLALAFR